MNDDDDKEEPMNWDQLEGNMKWFEMQLPSLTTDAIDARNHEFIEMLTKSLPDKFQKQLEEIQEYGPESVVQSILHYNNKKKIKRSLLWVTNGLMTYKDINEWLNELSSLMIACIWE